MICRVPVRTWSTTDRDAKKSKRERDNLTSLFFSLQSSARVFCWPNLPSQKLVQGSLSIAVRWEMEKSSKCGEWHPFGPLTPTTLFAQVELAPIYSRKLLLFYNVSDQDSWQLDRGVIFLYDLADRTNEGKSGSSQTLGRDSELCSMVSHPDLLMSTIALPSPLEGSSVSIL